MNYRFDRIGLVQRSAATRSWRFRSTKLSVTTERDTKHKASFNH